MRKYQLADLTEMNPESIQPTDLRLEMDGTQEKYEAYKVVVVYTDNPNEEEYDEEGCPQWEQSTETGYLLWFPELLRGGVAVGGDAIWTDADNPEDCVDRVLSGDLIE